MPVAFDEAGQKSRTTTQSSCQHLSAVVDWHICSCFALQIWPNQLCGGWEDELFLSSGRVLSHSLCPQSPTISQIVGASTKSKLKDYNEAGQKSNTLRKSKLSVVNLP